MQRNEGNNTDHHKRKKNNTYHDLFMDEDKYEKNIKIKEKKNILQGEIAIKISEYFLKCL